MKRVDAHVHVFEAQSAAYPREVGELAPPSRSARASLLLREMDAAGIDRAVLIQMGGTGIERHRYLAHCLRRWPNRFAGVGVVDTLDIDPAARLQELYEATGIVGIRLMGVLGDPASARAQDLIVYPLVERASVLGLNVNLYTQSTQVRCIELLMRAFPMVIFTLDHLAICPSTSATVDQWGRPRFEEEPIPPPTYPEIIDLAQYDNMCVKISGEYAFSREPFPYADMGPMVRRIYEAYGAERMMWSTDFPWIREEPGYQRLSTTIDHHLPDISQVDREWILGGSALRVWFRG